MPRSFFFLFGSALLWSLLSGCSVVGVSRDGDTHVEDDFVLQKETTGEDPWEYSRKAVSPDGTTALGRKKYPDVIIADNAEVKFFSRYFASKRRQFVEQSLERRVRYLPRLERIFRYYGLPTLLVNVAFVESGFKPKARSRSGAVGMWQFMKRTARIYGLKVTLFTDERKDVVKSTKAAAWYLADLYEIYGDWYLALAAYNGGSGRVNRAIRKSGSRDFFEIARKGYLRRETRDFVPKILSIARIAANPQAFGFN